VRVGIIIQTVSLFIYINVDVYIKKWKLNLNFLSNNICLWCDAERPSFVDVLDRLELARVEALLPMPGAAEFWFGAVGASDDAVDWAGMARALVRTTHMARLCVDDCVCRWWPRTARAPRWRCCATMLSTSRTRITASRSTRLRHCVTRYVCTCGWVYDDDDDDDVVWSGLRTRSLVVDVKAVALAYVPRRH